MTDAYHSFLASKAISDPMTGLDLLPDLPACLFPHQADIVRWALRRGRAAVFAGTGLGKTLMELAWAAAVCEVTSGKALIFAPPAVAAQMAREAGKFGIPVRLVTCQAECGPGINITNYQKLDRFDLTQFVAVALDESSILKSTDGHYRTRLIEVCASVPFRLAASATPAPNDFMELGNHAEFLGIMSYTDMLATFFAHDGGDTQKWRLKGHAEDVFWQWMASWAVMLRQPSDLGYSNDGYDLPALTYVSHVVPVEWQAEEYGSMFPARAVTMQERLAARRDTVEARIQTAVSIVASDFWAKFPECHGKTNTKPTDSQKLQLILNTLQGSKQNGAGHPKKIGSTCAPTTLRTKKSGGVPQKSGKRATPQDEQSTFPENVSGARAKVATNTKSAAATAPCEQNTASELSNTTPCLLGRTASAPSAGGDQKKSRTNDSASQSTTATKVDQSAVCSAAIAIERSVLSATEEMSSNELSSISTRRLDQWVVWCHLNSEQDALERAFGDLCYSARGSNSETENERVIEAWLAGERPVLIGKPSMLGFGLNFQCCHQTIFVGLNDSFEQFYQAVRRFWRFGQTQPVTAHIVSSELEGAVVANIRRKEADADRMAAAMVRHMVDLSSQAVRGMVRDRPGYDPQIPVQLPRFLEAA